MNTIKDMTTAECAADLNLSVDELLLARARCGVWTPVRDGALVWTGEARVKLQAHLEAERVESELRATARARIAVQEAEHPNAESLHA